MIKSPKIVFISWAPYCSRSDNIARELGGTSYMVYFAFLGSNYFTVWLKYILQTVKTLMIVFYERPDVVYVMSPPIIACIPVWIYCRIFNNKHYIIDSHTAAFIHKRWAEKEKLNRFFTKRALFTGVTNHHLGIIVERWKGRYLIVSDVPIEYPGASPQLLRVNDAKKTITLINTFAPDEPLDSFLEAASNFSDVVFYITGKINSSHAHYLNIKKKNIIFTDFIPNEDYGNLLRKSDIVCIFTTRDHTMLRGAYEAIYLGKPIIISDWPLLQEKFPIGTVHVDNTVNGITCGITSALQNIKSLTESANRLKIKKKAEWEQTKNKMLELMKEYV